MMKPWEVIAKLESDNSRLYKEAVVGDAATKGNAEFFGGCRLAYDPMVTFGVRKVPKHSGNDGPGLSWTKFVTLADSLSTRNVTGHAALDAIAAAMTASTAQQWDGWYHRILTKDLRCGMTEGTVNRVTKSINKAYMVPLFECQLAYDSANHESKVSGKKLIEVKLDGVRVLTIVHLDGRVDQFSRNGKELVNFSHIKTQFSAVAKELDEAYVFDGEVMSSSFQDLMTQINRKSNVNAGDAVLHLFDMIPLRDFVKGVCKTPQVERSRMLKDWMNNDGFMLNLVNVTTVGQELVDLDTKAGAARYKEINKQAVAGGYEGVMLKNPLGIYECKRSVAWLKSKPFIEVSLEVIAIEEGTGKNVGRMGALVCEGTDDGKLIKVNVGSGFTDAQRDEFWNCQVNGHIVEVRADAVTQNQDGSYSLRFPRFIRFRGFEKGEKI